MDAASGAGLFASLVGLIVQFLGEGRHREASDFNEFMKWLQEHNHEEIRSMLELNTQATIGIKALLNQSSAQIQFTLGEINSRLASIVSQMEGVSDIALGLSPENALTNQQLSVLCQIEETQAQYMMHSPTNSNPHEYLLGGGMRGSASTLHVSEPRFIAGDLDRLVRMDLLDLETPQFGPSRFFPTRLGAALVADTEACAEQD